MKKVVAAVVLIFGLAYCQAAREENNNALVLPNPALLRCRSTGCSQLWLENSAQTNASFPKQLIIDMDKGCLYGMTALHDKSIPLDDVKAAIDRFYSKWAFPENGDATTPIKLWRVQPEKFAIRLSSADKNDEKKNIAEAGTKLVIYIAFGGRLACKTP
jgi:hypothetical protein